MLQNILSIFHSITTSPDTLSPAEQRVLHGLITGATLKSHRDIDGHKIYRLHPLDRPAELINRATVATLKRRGFIGSNQKFPVATYLLTAKGHAAATNLVTVNQQPISARNIDRAS